MNEYRAVFKAGTRSSNLALIQSRGALERLSGLFPQIRWEQAPLSSPGDRDRRTDLKLSPGDFFSRDLDDAVIRGDLDCAIHSAKDLAYPLREELDWFWLPWAEDPKDALVCRRGEMPEDLPGGSLIGVSSERREEYCRTFFPDFGMSVIRGNIEQRLEQLDAGDYDMLLMASAALKRLGMQDRISREIPLKDLPVPEGQGILALTYRKGDARFNRIRSFFVSPVQFVGSGPGSAALCTVKGVKALENCDICLYDSLVDRNLLNPVKGKCVYTGKRSGRHSFNQETITGMISDYARQGQRVVRLKGGDPGIFGRLAEEAEELESLELPFEVVPGVSSLNAATTGTGMLLTRREVSRGYTAISSRVKDGGIADTDREARSRLPIVYFMSLKASGAVLNSLMKEGRSTDEPAAVVFNAGSPEQEVLRGTIGTMADRIARSENPNPGLLIAGEITSYGFDSFKGALEGQRILLTCSENLMDQAADRVFQLGGRPVKRSLIRLERNLDKVDPQGYDWIVLTSPSAVRFLIEILKEQHSDLRRLPKIMVCGKASEAVLEDYGIMADLCPPSSYGAEQLIAAAEKAVKEGDRVLRLRCEKASSKVSDALKSCGAEVTDQVLYANRAIPAGDLPDFDAVFFASTSAVEAFDGQWGLDPLKEKTVLAIGDPTLDSLTKRGLKNILKAEEATVPSAIRSLALHQIHTRLETLL